MGCNDCKNLKEKEIYIVIKKDKHRARFNIIRNPLPLELMLKINFKGIKSKKAKNENHTNEIQIIHELKSKKLGILFSRFLGIYSSNTFMEIKRIEPDYKLIQAKDDNNYFSRFVNFLELKNKDIIIWTYRVILLYKLTKRNYILYQVINEHEQASKKIIDNYPWKPFEYYNIISICELLNGNLVSCNSCGLRIYYKENNIYVLKDIIDFQYDIDNAIEIKPNVLLLLKRQIIPGGKCHPARYAHEITMYDIIEDKEVKLNSSLNDKWNSAKIHYLLKDKFIFIRYGDDLDVYNIKKNMQLLKKGNDIYEDDDENFRKKLQPKMRISLLCDYFYNLFIAKDKENKIKIYQFKEEKIKYFCDFPFQNKNIKGIIKLRNNAFIMYSNIDLMVLNYLSNTN